MKCSTAKIPNITNRKLVSPRRTIGSNIFSKVLFISKNAPLVEVLQPQQNLILCYTPSAFCSIHYETLLPQDLWVRSYHSSKYGIFSLTSWLLISIYTERISFIINSLFRTGVPNKSSCMPSASIRMSSSASFLQCCQ